MIFGVLKQADIWSILLINSYLCYFALEYHHKNFRYWNYLLIYIISVMALKYFFQLPFFCMGISETTRQWYPSVQPSCPDILYPDLAKKVQAVSFFAIQKRGTQYISFFNLILYH